MNVLQRNSCVLTADSDDGSSLSVLPSEKSQIRSPQIFRMVIHFSDDFLSLLRSHRKPIAIKTLSHPVRRPPAGTAGARSVPKVNPKSDFPQIFHRNCLPEKRDVFGEYASQRDRVVAGLFDHSAHLHFISSPKNPWQQHKCVLQQPSQCCCHALFYD
jgi:hypothetical protein